MSDDFRSFEEFWPYYAREHSKPLTRWMHFVGTAGVVGCVGAFAVTRKPRWLGAALLSGYGAAWLSHFFVEGNKPATFKHPLWSLIADFKMFGLMCVGKMDAEVESAMQADRANGNGAATAHDEHADVHAHSPDRAN